MTEEELDLLASAYVDGEATSEEVALVEGDPELLARVAELRAVSEQLAATPTPADALKQQHLAAALAEFSTVMADQQGEATEQTSQNAGSQNTAPTSQSTVPSLAEKRRDREARKADRSNARSMPQWLSAAAAFILIGGGVVFLAGRTGSDDSETAADSIAESAEDSSDDSADAAGASSSEARVFETEDAMEDEAMEESNAMASDAMEESAMDEDDSEAAEEAEVVPAEGDVAQSSPEPTTTTRAGGLFPDEPVRLYDEVPAIEGLLTDLPAPRVDLLNSRCGLELDEQLDLEVVGYLPIEIAGAPAEVFAVLTQDGTDSAIIVDEGCEQLAPGN